MFLKRLNDYTESVDVVTLTKGLEYDEVLRIFSET